MTETSFPWPDTSDPGPTVGDGRPYTDAEWAALWLACFGDGVVRGYGNEWAASTPGANQIDIDTGAAFVRGRFEYNTAVETLTPVSPVADPRLDSVILEVDYTGTGGTEQYTVRLQTKEGTDIAYPAMTQNAGVLWQYRLWNYTISVAGAISGITQTWAYCQFGTQVVTDMLIANILSANAAGRGKMQDGFLSADATGRAKMADLFLTTAKLADGALSADVAGRAKMADGFLSADATGRAKVADGFATNAKLAADAKRLKGEIIMWSGTLGAGGDAHFPVDPDTAAANYNWHICNGDVQNGVTTPNLADRFIVGQGATYTKGDSGGAATHTHAVAIASDNGGNHSHGGATGVPSVPDKNCNTNAPVTAVPNDAHTHTISASGNHQHGVNGDTAAGSTLPPYYCLIYICYVGT